MDGGALQAAVHGVSKSRTRLSDCTFTFTFMHWRRKWQPTPVFLPGESQGRQSLVGCRLWGRTESDTTEATQQQQQQLMKKNSIAPQMFDLCLQIFKPRGQGLTQLFQLQPYQHFTWDLSLLLGYPLRCRRFSCIPGLYPPDTRNSLLFPIVIFKKMSSDITKYHLEAQTAPT